MSKLELWLLRKLLKLVLTRHKLATMLTILWEEHERVYFEDNYWDRYHHIPDVWGGIAELKGKEHALPSKGSSVSAINR